MSIKLENKEVNYSAMVVQIHALNDLERLDRLKGFSVAGMQALVSLDNKVGDIGVLFPAESQLSLDYAAKNNLHRNSELNEVDEKGYLEDSRRVKAIKFQGNKSTALFMPLGSLSYLGIDVSELNVGDSFTHINGTEVCRKYEIQDRQSGSNKTRGKTKKWTRIDNKTFPEHWDTDNFFRCSNNYHEDDNIVVTQKVHGTSARFTNQVVSRKLNWFEKLLEHFGVSISNVEYDTLAGSRRVIKDVKCDKVNDHFYSVDLWNEWLSKIEHIIPKNYVLYGEIVGYIGTNKSIQKNYTYDCVEGQNKLYIYRITVVNEDGVALDLSWDQVVEFCHNNGLDYVPELWRGKFSDFNVDEWLNVGYNKLGFSKAIPLCDSSPCDEGVCVRREGITPYVTKAKSPDFLVHETKQIDSGNVDTESAET